MKLFQFTILSKDKLLHSKNVKNILFFSLIITLLISLSFSDIVTDLNSKGNLLKNSGKYTEALDSYNQALNLDDNSVSSWTGKADVLLNLGRYEEALHAYDKLIALDPKNYWAHINKGDALKGLNRFDEALLLYESAIYLDSKIVNGYVGKGNVLYNLKKYDEAIDAFEQAIDIDPEDPWIYISKGDSLQKIQKYNEAIDSYDQAISLKPDDPWIITPKGDALQLLNKFEDAVKIYDQALKNKPDEPWIWVSKGDALQQLQKYEDAVKAYDQAITINPNEPWIWASKGNTLLQLKKYEDAVKAYDQAITLNPQNSWNWYLKGNALKSIHKNEEALSAYDFALKIKPNFTEAENNRELLLKNISINVSSEKITQLSTIVPDETITHFIKQQKIESEKNWLDSFLEFIFGENPKEQGSSRSDLESVSVISPHSIITYDDYMVISDKNSKSLLFSNFNGTILYVIDLDNAKNNLFEEITDFTVDNNKNIYVLDAISKKVVKTDFFGTIMKSWQLYDSKNYTPANPSCISFASQMNNDGIILLTDLAYPCILKYDTDGNFIDTIQLTVNQKIQNNSEKFYNAILNVDKGNYANIIPNNEANPLITERIFDIKCASKIYPMKFIVNRSEYLGSQENKDIDFTINNENPEKWLPIITDALHDPVTVKTIKETGDMLNGIYHEYQLKDSEYFDLITGFIQQIPLSEETNMRFPIEVLHDKKGSSQDKAIFLYALLHHAGFDVKLLSYPGTSHCAVAVKTKNIGNPDSVTYYKDSDENYLYINPDKPDLAGRISISAKKSDPFLFDLLPTNNNLNEIPESINRIYILETLSKIRKKQEYIEENINKFVSTAQRKPRQDLEKIRTVTQYVESQPWNTEGNLLRLKNSKVEDIVLNYGLK